MVDQRSMSPASNAIPTPSEPMSKPATRFGILRSLAAILRDSNETEHGAWLVMRFDRADREGNFLEFAADPHGARILAGAPSLFELLTDRATLSKMPEGSLGRAYLAFMEREGISTESLEAEVGPIERMLLGSDPPRARFHQHTRACHDLWHVLTGYGRDPLGEAQLIVFSREQAPSRAYTWIGRMARLTTRRSQPEVLPLFDLAARRGRRSRRLVAVDWQPLLGEPLEWVREILGIGAPPDPMVFGPAGGPTG